MSENTESAAGAVAPQETPLPMEPLLDMTCPVCEALVDLTGIEPFSEINCASCNSPIQVPAKFAHFFLLKRLGSGGMGTTFLGEDEALGRKVAIKAMQNFDGADGKAFETFKNEAQNAARLNHPHVAQVYSFGKEKDVPYLEMELVPGGDLGKFIADKVQLDPAFVIRVGEEIAEGLKAAEEGGLFHGDVKPDNILFDENMSAKLVDFGIASRASQGAGDELWGTPFYIAPEKVQQKKNSARSDIYSLGATLYHAIAGIPPYDGADAVEVIKARFAGPPKPIDQVRPDVEPEVARIISRMMYNDLFMRYPNYNSLIGDMKKYLSQVPAIRKQGPKGSATAALKAVTGKLGAEGTGSATQRTGKRKFVVNKGQIADAESRKALTAVSPASQETQKTGSRIRIKGKGGSVTIGAPVLSPGASLQPDQQGENPEQAKEKSGGGNGARNALIGMFVGFFVLLAAGIGFFLYSRAKDKEAERIAIQNREKAIAAADQIDKIDSGFETSLEDIRKKIKKVEESFSAIQKTFEDATGGSLEIPDLTPPPIVREEETAAEAGVEENAEAAAAASDGALVTAKQAEAEAAEEAKKPVPQKRAKKTALMELAEWYVQNDAAPDVTSAIDMIREKARLKKMDAEAYALEELGGELEDDEEEESTEESGEGSSSAGSSSSEPETPQASAHPLTDRAESLLWTHARDLRIALRDAEYVVAQAADTQVKPFPDNPDAQDYETALKAREELLKKHEAWKEELAQCAKRANNSLNAFNKGKKAFEKEANPYKNERVRLAKEEQKRLEAEEAARRAEEDAAALAALTEQEIARVRQTANQHLHFVKEFNYKTFREKMQVMLTGTKNSTVQKSELETDGGKQEVRNVIERIDRVEYLQNWLVGDLQTGALNKGYRWVSKEKNKKTGKPDSKIVKIEGASQNGKTIFLDPREGKGDVLVKDLKAEDWIRLFQLLVEKRDADRNPKLTPPEHGKLCLSMALFYTFHFQGEENETQALERALELARKGAAESAEVKSNLVRLMPVFETESVEVQSEE